MLRFLWIFIFFEVVLTVYPKVFAQKTDSLSVQKKLPLTKKNPIDTSKIGFAINKMRVGLDLIGIARLSWEDKYSLHLNTDISFRNKNLLVVEYTFANTAIASKANYTSTANIARLGYLRNFLYKQSKQDVFALGIRFAHAWYEESISSALSNPIFGSTNIGYTNTLQANWVEFNMELKARIWRKFLIGYQLRYQFKPSVKGDKGFISYEIPSVGRISKNNFGFQYGIWYLISFEK